MHDVAALMHAIHDLPHDDLPRLALADWLEENGQADRAEFIRVQLALAALPREDPRFRPVFQRELELLRAHKDAWFGTFRSAWTYYDCRRGFIEEVWGPADNIVPRAGWLVLHHALQRVCLQGNLRQLGDFLDSPLPDVVRMARFNPERIAPAVPSVPPSTEPLARRPLHLAVHYFGNGADLVATLTGQPLPARLGTLDLSTTLIGPDNVWPLLNALESCPLLTHLDLGGGYQPRGASGEIRANIGNDGVIYLADHPLVARLHQLNLAHNAIVESGARALIESPHLANVGCLVLGEDARQLPGPFRRELRQRFGSRLVGLLDV
jgi:uncharacterized protein (TIGR02996 family)